ncbi:uncharacterized protein A1O9_10255 [Exophiala aquamarina CBS 119918]|uniref:Uncharacterized protein n=1 Tax=Exophiala aquamarina CBS 119918 TaxID=1182545 RepID=A0A072P3L3_9EURO|nr:uncharacterized protein A1O9_10255 [Exophiala aquamarina CBS 119918]KEF53853.1 hypothetical protein A1O9_10255 [Exophiala aquamarina CBS 119918]
MASVAASNIADGDYQAFVKLVSSQHAGPLPDLNTFHKYILSKPEGPANLGKLASVDAPNAALVDVKSGGPDFSQQASASGSVLNLWVYQRVTVTALGKECVANMGGITPGFPGGATFGTLYYNNISDLSGDCDVAFAGLGPYFSLYYRRNGATFAMYQAGNVGWTSGTAGGTGTWSDA